MSGGVFNARLGHVQSHQFLRGVLLFTVLFVAFAVFVPARQIVDVLRDDNSIALERGVCYRSTGGCDLTMDVAMPERGKSPFPLLVFIHGGGWRYEGEGFRSEIQTAAERGYVAARISYRLLTPRRDGTVKNAFPAQLDDVNAALDYLRQHRDRYHLDPERIGLVGMSAGGHLALLAGLEGNDATGIKAIVNFYGPCDLTYAYQHHPESRRLLELLLEATPRMAAQRYKAASPIYLANRRSPPVLTIHGSEDTVVPLNQSKRLDERMRRVGASHQLEVLPGEVHGFSAEGMQRAMHLMYAFAGQHLRPSQPSHTVAHRRSSTRQVLETRKR